MEQEKVNRNIVLIGFMGSGKTVIGRNLARLLERDFIDTDEEIEKVTDLSVTKLFKKYGERRFRSEEELVIKKLHGREGLVIATGGSMDLDNHNLDLLRDDCWFVHLKASLDILSERLSRKNTRPLLGKNPSSEKIHELLSARMNQYEELADFTLDTGLYSVEECAALIAEHFSAL